MKLAMSVGNNNHYRIDRIYARHFIQTGERAGLTKALVREAIDEVRAQAEDAVAQVENALPSSFPAYIHDSVSTGLLAAPRSGTAADRRMCVTIASFGSPPVTGCSGAAAWTTT